MKDISYEKNLLLSEAKSKYPIGTMYCSATAHSGQLQIIRGELYVIGRDKDKLIITDHHGGSVYHNGKWALRVEDPRETPLEKARRIIYED